MQFFYFQAGKMYTHTHQLRVRYSETDRMNYVYYGHYAQYFEVARVEALRHLGVSYKSMEASGILLPVIDLQVKFVRPATYDELLTIKTTIPVLPSVRIVFDYEVFNESEVLLNKASTTLVFVDASTMKPRKAPEELLQKLSSFFS
jgi:acyl-CoA thioester hydrolase